MLRIKKEEEKMTFIFIGYSIALISLIGVYIHNSLLPQKMQLKTEIISCMVSVIFILLFILIKIYVFVIVLSVGCFLVFYLALLTQRIDLKFLYGSIVFLSFILLIFLFHLINLGH